MTDLEQLRQDFKEYAVSSNTKLDSLVDKIGILSTEVAKFVGVTAQVTDHEIRLRAVEKETTVTSTKIAIWSTFGALGGSLLTAALMKLLGAH